MDALSVIAQFLQSFSTNQSSDGRTDAAQTPQTNNTLGWDVGAGPSTRPALQPCVAQVTSTNTLPVPFSAFGATAPPTTSSTLHGPLAGAPYPAQWTSYSATAANQSAPQQATARSAPLKKKAKASYKDLVDGEDILENGDELITCLWFSRACDSAEGGRHKGECDDTKPECAPRICGLGICGREMWEHVFKVHSRDNCRKARGAKDAIRCLWDENGACPGLLQPSSLKKHIEGVHTRLRRRCKYCGSAQRQDMYLNHHGLAANCALNPHARDASSLTRTEASGHTSAHSAAPSSGATSSRSSPERSRHAPYGAAGSTSRKSSGRAQGHLVDPTSRASTSTVPSIAKARRRARTSRPNQPSASSSSTHTSSNCCASSASSFLAPSMQSDAPWDATMPLGLAPGVLRREPSQKFGVPPRFPWHGPYMPGAANVGFQDAATYPGLHQQLQDISTSASTSAAAASQGPTDIFTLDGELCDELIPSVSLDGAPSQTYPLDLDGFMDWEGPVIGSDPASNADMGVGGGQFSLDDLDAFLATLGGSDIIPPSESDAVHRQAAPALPDPLQIGDPLQVQATLPVSAPVPAPVQVDVDVESPGVACAQYWDSVEQMLLPEHEYATEGGPEIDFSAFLAELEPGFSSW
ncbi:hypothetical protein C8Q80DRAFT_1174474 [Daedaleopsis nitida]|nr:hypothetical protein C8Q80DRAFT_1174474 [Daedaleopsis nitida]